jgi:hypothetical protein
MAVAMMQRCFDGFTQAFPIALIQAQSVLNGMHVVLVLRLNAGVTLLI